MKNRSSIKCLAIRSRVTEARGFPDRALMEEGRLGAKSPCYRWRMEHHPDAAGDLHFDGSSFRFEEESCYERWSSSQALDFIGDGDDTPYGRPYCQAEELEVAG